MQEISPEQLDAYFDSFQRNAFRLEVHDLYETSNEKEAFQAFLSGERSLRQINSGWTSYVREGVAKGRTFRRVHVVTFPLTPYVQFEIEWGYRFSVAAGEQIFLVDRASVALRQDEARDFWMFDSSLLIFMDYTSDGRFLRPMLDVRAETFKSCERTIDQLLKHAVPVQEFFS